MTLSFLAIFALQIWKMGQLQFPILAPLLLLLTTGLAAGLMPSLKPIQMRLMFLSAYGSAFLLLWAKGNPNADLPLTRTWIATTLTLLGVIFTLTWVHTRSKKRGWPWALAGAVAFGLFIAYFSGPAGGPGWMATMIGQLLGTDDWRIIKAWVIGIRKTLHVTGYGGAAFCTAWAAYCQGATKRVSSFAAYAWLLPLATFDEWSQASAANRSGRPQDVLLDALGITLFLGLFWWQTARQEGKQSAEP